MRKNIIFNITKHVKVDESPFGIVIYIYKDRNTILVEDMISGKCVQASSYDIGKYLRLDNVQTEWKRSFNHSYTRMQNSNVEYFMPLYMETNRFATLSFDIINRMKPDYRTKRVPDPSDVRVRGREINVVNNGEEEPDRSGGTGIHLKTYNELYEKVKDFETDNFKLEMIENEKEKVYDENFELIKSPYITCRLPMFQIYALLIPSIHNESNIRFGYRQELTMIRIKDRFYRFPYGNISSNDHMCLGNHSYSHVKNQPDSIQDAAYAGMITSVFNGDYMPNIKFNNQVPSCFDIDVLREKVKNNDFAFSFMDALFYLSQCESIEDLNLNMFILTPSVPKPISDFERKLLNKPQDEDDEPLWLPEETTADPNDTVPIRNPEAGFEQENNELPEFVVPVEGIRVRDELRDHTLNHLPREVLSRYNPESHGHVSTTATIYANTSTNSTYTIQGGTLENLTGEELQERVEQFGVQDGQHFDSAGTLITSAEQINVHVREHIPVEEINLNFTVEELHEQALDQQLQAEIPQDININDHERRTIDLTEALANPIRNTEDLVWPINNTEGEENDNNRESTITNQ